MASRSNRSNTATMLHSIAEELGCAPELVGVVKTELKLRSRKDILHATQERIAQMAAQDEPAAPVDDAATDKPKKEKKAGLTLSQRRALLRLLESDDGVAPATGFKALPYLKLVDVGYAVVSEPTEAEPQGRFVLTLSGEERAKSINPGYLVWSAGESVAGDESRPAAGTHRVTKAEADAAKAAADAKVADDSDSDTETEADASVEVEVAA